MQPLDKIEILSVALLEENRFLVNELRRLAGSLNLEFGWHYLLDLCWIIKNLGAVEGRQIMDAGAGIGVLQWYLAQRGARVLSVDRNSRLNLPIRFRRRFRVMGFDNRHPQLAPAWRALVTNLNSIGGFFPKVRYLSREVSGFLLCLPAKGQVIIYDYDLQDLNDLPDCSLDAVVALSALEHNAPKKLGAVIAELWRLLKPGGCLLATLGAARDEDWFHEPSQGWCYTEKTLREIFDLPSETPSNFNRYDDLFTDLYHCAELRDNLASFYFRSGENGMPWGIWEPKYQSVGVLKVKRF